MAYCAVHILFALPAGDGEDDITVTYADRVSYGSLHAVGKLPGKFSHFSDGRVFFENDLTLAVGEYFQGISLANPQGAPDFLWNYDPTQFVNPANNTCSLHIGKASLCRVEWNVLRLWQR